MPDEQRFRGKPGPFLGLAMLLAGLMAASAGAQETVYIGGREAGPPVQVDLSALNPERGIPVRRTRPGPPDILPLDPANAPPARSATSMPLPLLQPSAPVQPSVPVEPSAAAPAMPRAEASATATPMPLKPGLTPPAAPPPAVAKANLGASAAPRPIVPARRAPPAASLPEPAAVKPPPASSAPQAVAALPAGLTPAQPSSPASDAAAAILFSPGAVELTAEATAQLDAVLAALTDKQRLQLKAHASGGPDDAEVRRTALKRALSARSHLLAAGLESTRIDVRAIGPAGDGGPDDRLDVIVVAQ